MDATFGFDAVVGESPAIRSAIELATKLARSQVTHLLIEGERGTGKELFARGIHYMGPHPDEPLAAVNCSAIPATLLESELFGHERGAFTDAWKRKRGLLEVAGAGTLVLDEIAAMPLGLQPKLLRVLEDRTARRLGGVEEIPIRCRMVAATNVSLQEPVGRKEFRADLFHRLNVFRIVIPPLRERVADIRVLARHFLRTLAEERLETPKELGADAAARLEAHPWPGNVRELKHVIERAAALADGRVVRAEHVVIQRRVPVAIEEAKRGEAHTAPASDGSRPIWVPPAGLALEDAERQLLEITMQQCEGNRSAAARTLGVSRPRLLRMLRKYGLDDARVAAGSGD